MVKLNVAMLQFLEDDDFRVLAALEMAIRNHELAPLPLIERIANLPRGGAGNRLREMLRYKLIHHDRQLYDGYAMKYAAYDYLALHVFTKRGVLTGVGAMVGMGKESDVYAGCDADHNDLIVKFERLGRCSFRSVARNRAYTKSGQRGGASWFYLSRLAATKEFAYMQALYEEGFPVPKPIDHNRHVIVMERIKGRLLAHIDELKNPSKTFHQCMDVLVRLAQNGLIHGDFNEFNLMITDAGEDLVMIDFPQMVSTSHPNGADLFERDVKCVHTFFQRKFKLSFEYWPTLSADAHRTGYLDARIAKGKFTEAQQRDLEKMTAENPEGNGDSGEEEGGEGAVNEEDLTRPPPRHVDPIVPIHEVQKMECGESEATSAAASVPTSTVNRPSVIAVPTSTMIDARRVREKLQREANKKSLNELKQRTMHRNQFKTKDKRQAKNEMKQMREINEEMN